MTTRRRFVVIGLGSFGHHVARALYRRGQDVLALDNDPAAVDAIRPYCSRAVLADASDRTELEAAGAGEAEVGIVGLGSRMDASILACLFLKELGVKEIFAKAITEEHGRILERIAATDLVHPEKEAAHRLAQQLARPELLEELPFLEGYGLVELPAPRRFWGRTLAESALRSEYGVAVVMIRRREQGREVTVPAVTGQTMRQGDHLVLLGSSEKIGEFRRKNPQ
jgi:trk system potassium uptake protein